MQDSRIMMKFRDYDSLDESGGGLVGGSSESKRKMSNKPPPVLFPNKENLSQYAAVFPGYSIDKGNVLTLEPNMGNQLFTLDYHP